MPRKTRTKVRLTGAQIDALLALSEGGLRAVLRVLKAETYGWTERSLAMEADAKTLLALGKKDLEHALLLLRKDEPIPNEPEHASLYDELLDPLAEEKQSDRRHTTQTPSVPGEDDEEA